jgi:hypothetical protein
MISIWALIDPGVDIPVGGLILPSPIKGPDIDGLECWLLASTFIAALAATHISIMADDEEEEEFDELALSL